jgi:hypothetical protein
LWLEILAQERRTVLNGIGSGVETIMSPWSTGSPMTCIPLDDIEIPPNFHLLNEGDLQLHR